MTHSSVGTHGRFLGRLYEYNNLKYSWKSHEGLDRGVFCTSRTTSSHVFCSDPLEPLEILVGPRMHIISTAAVPTYAS